MERTTENRPITPPDELVQQWLGEYFGCEVSGELSGSERYLASQSARWGADQELKACCEWASQFNYDDYHYQDELQSLRRPKPPSLKEQALTILDDIPGIDGAHYNTLRRALEQLDD